MQEQLALASVLLMLAASTGTGTYGHHEAPSPQGTSKFEPAAITIREIPIREIPIREIPGREIPGRSLFELVDEKLVFTDGRGTKWEAPRGTLTDGASVPSYLLMITNGRFQTTFLKAAVVHDACCQEFNKDGSSYRKRSWHATHRMFHEGCLLGGTSAILAGKMYIAVWCFGPRWSLVKADASELQLDATDAMQLYAEGIAWLEQEKRLSNKAIDEWLIRTETSFWKKRKEKEAVPSFLGELQPRKE